MSCRSSQTSLPLTSCHDTRFRKTEEQIKISKPQAIRWDGPRFLTAILYPSTLLNLSNCGRTNHLSPTKLMVSHLKIAYGKFHITSYCYISAICHPSQVFWYDSHLIIPSCLWFLVATLYFSQISGNHTLILLYFPLIFIDLFCNAGPKTTWQRVEKR